MIQRLFADEEGQTLIEYGLLTALIAVVALVVLGVVGRRGRDTYVTVNDKVTTLAR